MSDTESKLGTVEECIGYCSDIKHVQIRKKDHRWIYFRAGEIINIGNSLFSGGARCARESTYET
jgi:hypothetical protein